MKHDTSLPDPRPAFARATDIATTTAAAVDPDQLELPTPCDAMNVRDLLGHLHMSIRRVAAIVGVDSPQELPVEDESITDDGWPAAIAAAAAEAQAAWTDDALLARVMHLPWTDAPGAEVVAIYLNETIVHTWDLARATGQHPTWDDADLELAFAAIQSQMPMADRGPMWEAALQTLPPEVLALRPWAEPFANAVEVSDDAPLIDRLVAWNGRRP